MSEDRLKAAETLIKHLADYFWCEMSWEYFRAEFLADNNTDYENARKNNAQAIAKFMKDMGEEYPEFKTLLKVTP